MDIYVWGTHDCAERKKDFVDDFIKKREREGGKKILSPHMGDKKGEDKTEIKRKDKRNPMNDSIWLILWIGAKNDSMAFLRPYKSILQSELVTSSNNSTPVKYQGKNFSLQPDSFFLFFFFSTIFIRRESGGCLEIFRDDVKRNVGQWKL